jgi:3D (Asp-Asp-Asp) domain-containing protein
MPSYNPFNSTTQSNKSRGDRMKHRIILGVTIGVNLLTNMAIYTYYDEQLTIAHKTESILRKDIETKSTEIAKLSSVIKDKDEAINQQVIEIARLQEEMKAKEAELRKAQQEVELIKAQQEAERKKQEKTITVEATAYTAFCNEGCTGRTATGVNVANSIYYKGHRVIAVDTDLIPLNSLVRVEVDGKVFTAMAIDRGGGINGYEIDLLVSNEQEAIAFGRKEARLTVLKNGQ